MLAVITYGSEYMLMTAYIWKSEIAYCLFQSSDCTL